MGDEAVRYFWLIEQFENDWRTGVYVYDIIGLGPYVDTTGWRASAKKFNFKWTAQLWNWVYNQSYRPGCEWRATKHRFRDIGSALGLNAIWIPE